MSRTQSPRLSDMVRDYGWSWKDLAVADVLYKTLAFVLLTPLVGILFRTFIALSGRSVLADQDILHFFLSPLGWVTAILVGALWVGVLALEQAALMTIAAAATERQRIRVRESLEFTAARVLPVLRLTGRMVILALAAALPFLALAGVTYLALLTKYDINYYLAARPPAFLAAAAIGAALLLALGAVLVRITSAWLFALPLLLFEQLPPRAALATSRERSAGQRRRLVAWIVAWLAAASLLSAVATALVGLLGRLSVPLFDATLPVMLMAVGGILLLWGITSFATTLVSTTAFSVMTVRLYRQVANIDDTQAFASLIAESTANGVRMQFTRRRLVALSLVSVLVAAAVGGIVIETVRTEDNAQITAHRGASATAPENTLAAFQHAIDEGADWVELDVQESVDGIVVVVHDSDLKRVGGSGRKIWEATAGQLRRDNIGSWFDPQFSDQRVPTLDEALALCKGKIRLNIELKFYGHNERLEQRVAELVEKHGMQHDVVIMSLEQTLVKRMKSLRPQWTVGLLTAVAMGDLTRVDADFLAVNVGLATRSFVRDVHRAGKDVYVWTVNDPVTMSVMIGRNVDNVITDRPSLGRTVLKQRSGLNSVERLMLEVAFQLGAVRAGDLQIEDF